MSRRWRRSTPAVAGGDRRRGLPEPLRSRASSRRSDVIPSIQNRFTDVKIYTLTADIFASDIEGLRPGKSAKVSFLDQQALAGVVRLACRRCSRKGGQAFAALPPARSSGETKWDMAEDRRLGLMRNEIHAGVVKGLSPGREGRRQSPGTSNTSPREVRARPPRPPAAVQTSPYRSRGKARSPQRGSWRDRLRGAAADPGNWSPGVDETSERNVRGTAKLGSGHDRRSAGSGLCGVGACGAKGARPRKVVKDRRRPFPRPRPRRCLGQGSRKLR